METLLQDIKYGLRMLLKSPGLTAVAALSLGLGIGANTTIYSLINTLFLKPLPIEDGQRVVAVYTTDEKNKSQFEVSQTSYPNFKDYRERNQVFSEMAAHQFVGLNVTGAGEPEQTAGQMVDANYFTLLGVQARLGRVFQPEEGKVEGAAPVAVLSHGYWTRRFGADANVVGRSIGLNGHPFTIVGVLPAGFGGLVAFGGPDLFVPMSMHKELLTGFMAENYEDRRALTWDIVARLKPGVTEEQARADLRRIGSQLEKEYPEPNGQRNSTLLPIAQALINPGIRNVFVMAGGLLMTVVALVLLIACANVANLLLARSGARRKEIAIRLSLGAARGRLIRQLLTESVLLALLGGTLGFLFAYWSRDLLVASRPAQFPNIEVSLDARVFLFTLAISIATGILFGLAPAIQSSRSDLAVELKDRTQEPAARRRVSLRGGLVVAQVALSLVALVGAGLFIQSLRNTQQIDPGFEPKNLLVMSFDVGAQGYDQARGEAFYRDAVERAKALPGVRSASLAANLPIAGGGFSRTVFPEGRDQSTGSTGTFVVCDTTAPGYLDTLDIALHRGRDLTEADRPDKPLVVLINEAMAAKFWPGEEAVGKRFKFYGDPDYRQVAGVVENTKLFSLGEEPQPKAFVPLGQYYEPAMTLLVRTTGDPKPLLESVRRAVQGMDANLPLTNVQTVSSLLDQALWAPRMAAILLSIFGGLALLLATIGVYGVTSYSVGQRTHEFGLRMALGARTNDVLGLVLKQGMRPVAIGVGLGLVAALWVTRYVATLLVGVGATDPVVFSVIALLLLAVAALAGYVPARRATRVSPTVALRYE
ncbi:MAG TPA: ABC transporter permease [Candidatus Polarisedimenticolia bacterium]|nr:ABC transporter permease [Candidatus Polarisedimenticolia bacterium]